jgi:hypothetical protein
MRKLQRSATLPILGWTGVLLSTLLVAAPYAAAQTNVRVSVAVDKPLNIITDESLGVYTDIYDTATSAPKVAAYMHTAGMYTFQYPGGYGSYADLYHWSTGTGTKYENFAKQDHFYPSETNLAHMVPAIDKLGTALITINYGSNKAGTGGGEPAEAAAFVAYMNGDPSDAKAIGKDSTGEDWRTVGYWAALRAQAPLAEDDGLNVLRANHPKPLNIEFWQIGSEVYNNGYYGADHKSEEDLHAPYPASENDNEKRRHNANLSPTFYGERINEFARAMHKVDPKVKIGATLNLAPIDSSWGPDWNPGVLKAGCASIDFVSLEWRPDYRTSVAPYDTRDDAATLRAPEEQIGQFLNEVVYEAKKLCPAGKVPRIAITQMSPIHWAKVPSKLSDGLFAADAFALLTEIGSITTDWNELHDGYFMNSDNTPGPAFYGVQMLHIVAFRPGDELVSVNSSSPEVAAHAVKRQDGGFGLMLINKGPYAPAEVKVEVSGGNYATHGARFDYGQEAFKAGSGVAKTAFASGGNSFSVTVLPYTITDIVLAKAQ